MTFPCFSYLLIFLLMDQMDPQNSTAPPALHPSCCVERSGTSFCSPPESLHESLQTISLWSCNGMLPKNVPLPWSYHCCTSGCQVLFAKKLHSSHPQMFPDVSRCFQACSLAGRPRLFPISNPSSIPPVSWNFGVSFPGWND
jgi:hypothetical protein